MRINRTFLGTTTLYIIMLLIQGCDQQKGPDVEETEEDEIL